MAVRLIALLVFAALCIAACVSLSAAPPTVAIAPHASGRWDFHNADVPPIVGDPAQQPRLVLTLCPLDDRNFPHVPEGSSA